MELPPYRMPLSGHVVCMVWERVRDFSVRAGAPLDPADVCRTVVPERALIRLCMVAKAPTVY
jgi:hypothetical protein